MENIRTERLAGWGEQAARSIPITGTVSGKKTARDLAAAMDRVAALARDERSPAWYADNEYLVRREGGIAREAFLTARERLRRGPDEAALVMLCQRLVDVGPITEERVEEFLIGARRSEEMPETEAALVGAALRMAVIQTLAKSVDAERAGELFTGLRTLAELDLTDALEHSDPVDELLRRDAVYPLMDESTRAMYRETCQRLAKKHRTSPLKEAQTALETGLHDYLYREPERSGAGYITVHIVFSVLLALGVGYLSGRLWIAALVFLPLSELVGASMDMLLLRFVKPRRLPRLELKDGVGPQGRTICAVSALLTDDDTAPALARRLEEYRLANRDCGDDLLFALLADLPDAKTFPVPEGTARLDAARRAIEKLNARYGGGFYLLTRDPQWNPADKQYTPWERKRGAILELCRLSQGRTSVLKCLAGERGDLRARYILCLDGDTRLVPGAARQLIGAAMHPANRPVIQKGVVVRGHGVIHPRMSVELDSALATDFARLYAGQGGTDPYGSPTGELFFDLFGRGGFSGKGVLDAAAYLTCLDERFPENTVLSHDALEGAYLRGAYMGDVELTDSAPANAVSWFRRLHRWVRGDWQNMPWLFDAGKDLSALDKWRLLDSLRRSLVPSAAFIAIALSLLNPAFSAAGITALVCLGAEAVRCAFTDLFLPTRDARLRCRSGVFRGASGALTRFLSRLILLPWEAFTCLSAAVTALWRMSVGHRNMLQWTTAAQTNSMHNSPTAMWFTVLFGAALIVLAPEPIGIASGIIWLLAPGFAKLTGRPRSPKNELTDADRNFLLDSAKSIWAYFDQNCTRQDHWLPPDNVQVQPPKGAARRTSPTNIGLAISSAVAAMELDICPADHTAAFIENIMSTIERLPRWRGHLYNWYDTGTCAPLQPAYVSTVDSGNLCACLIAASDALAERGYDTLSRRVSAFADEIDLGALYDRKKRLFYIGLDPASDKVSPGHYDLMASEARLTSYIACARGEVPLRHWQALSRAQLSLDGWRGLASWSGSMFEYLMPELFLPLVEGSLLWETGRFCLYAQRRHTRSASAPWGSSESGFFSLDAGLDYRYKAHGAGALALRRDVDAELVIAPYASFLALCVHPKAAVKNLRRLKRAKMWGKYGPYEALDMTPGRTGKDGEPVMSFMSHHLGMSLCAAANCLKGGVMRRHFMDVPECAAFRPLLCERVPLGGPLLRRNHSPLTRPPESRIERPAFEKEGSGYDPAAPAIFPMSNGVYSVLAGADGSCTAQSGGILMYDPEGLELSADDRPLTSSRRLSTYRPWRYAGGTLTFTTPYSTSVMSTSMAVASGECGELRRITGKSGGRLTLRFRPVLAKASDYFAHPAFWRLGLEVSAKYGAVFVRRLSRDGLPELWLCIAATTALSITRGAGWQTVDPVVLTAALPEGGCAAVSIAFGRSRDAAHGAARRILSGGAADMPGSMATLLGLNAEGIAAAFDLCGSIAANRVSSGENASREGLWKLGLSGDLPILYTRVRDDLAEARRLIKRHALLTACGVRADLVIDTGEEGDYLHPNADTLRRFLDRYGIAAFEGQPGGVHFGGNEAVRAAALRPLPPGTPNGPALPGARPAPERGSAPPEIEYLTGGAVRFQTPPMPPRAWSNILSNGDFGYIAADSGTGHMWYQNARECPISPWLNDPIAVTGGETLELITAAGRRSLFADGINPCRVIHGFGWTRWETEKCSVTAFIPLDHKARILLIEGGDGAYIGWHLPLALTADRTDARFVTTAFQNSCLEARNPRCAFPDTVFRAVVSRDLSGFTCSDAAWRAGRPDGKTGAGLDPCFGALWDGGGVSVLACGCEAAETLRALANPDRAAKELIRVRDYWRNLLSRVHIHTPDENLNRLMNGWAAYQTISCRIMGRSSLYQNGGAFGFRDQLQDAVNILLIDPNRTRRQILLACTRQFREGDVLHWWHESPDGPRGVRTHCSDDLLWLPWALCEYVEKTGDHKLCRENAAWLDAAPLRPEESDRYFTPPATELQSPVLEHAKRAIDCVLARGHGPHGLLLTGSGDWNDGMNRVGGESVWLTWFFVHTAGRFAKLLERLGEPGSLDYAKAAKHYTQAAEHAWDGNWYLRGWWQDGAPLGAAGAPACAIDSIAQSWAAFCPGVDQGRVKTALRACMDNLYDEAHSLTKLFAPPFGEEGRDPGYIRACGPGFRENGGQYTHGALWLASALLKKGFTEDGAKVLLSTMPARHNPAQWGAEPYVLAADVSANADHYGEALWSWYTGSAGWFFRVVLEDLLGIRLKDGHLVVEPHLPEGWEGYEAEICSRRIQVRHGRATIS